MRREGDSLSCGNYCQETNKQTTKKKEKKKKKQTKRNHSNSNNNNRKLKAVGNITTTMDHYTKNREMADTNPQSNKSC